MSLLLGGMGGSGFLLGGMFYQALPCASYDPTTVLGITRLCVSDTNVNKAIWCDVEVTVALSRTGNVPERAGAWLLRSAAADAARLAVITKRGTYGNDRREVYKGLLAAAAALDLAADKYGTPETDDVIGGICIAPDAVFTLPTDGEPGSMDIW